MYGRNKLRSSEHGYNRDLHRGEGGWLTATHSRSNTCGGQAHAAKTYSPVESSRAFPGTTTGICYRSRQAGDL